MTEDLEQLRAENARLRKSLELISIVDQGCGGSLSYREIAESAMRQASAALSAYPAPVVGGPDWEGFGRALMEDWPTGDIEGSDLFDLSRKYRLIVEVPGGYDPEEHIDAGSIYPEKGDPWFEYNFRGERQ